VPIAIVTLASSSQCGERSRDYDGRSTDNYCRGGNTHFLAGSSKEAPPAVELSIQDHANLYDGDVFGLCAHSHYGLGHSPLVW